MNPTFEFLSEVIDIFVFFRLKIVLISSSTMSGSLKFNEKQYSVLPLSYISLYIVKL